MEYPKVGDLIEVFSHNCKDCLGVHPVVKVEDDGYTHYKVEGVGICSTFRERYFIVKEKEGGRRA